MTMRVDLSEPEDRKTRMAMETTFTSREAMERILSMGMEEGLQSAIAQIDTLLGAP